MKIMEPGARIRRPVPAARWRRGATVIELLVVVAILALLVAILLPSLSSARQQARRMACAGQLRAVGHALNLYQSGLGRYPNTGDRDPANIRRTSLNPSAPRLGRSPEALTAIADLAEALVISSLGDPWALYCPSSLESDRHAPRPYTRVSWNRQMVPTWRTGNISYMYLVGLDYQQPEASFPDSNGRTTFDPRTESPERRVNRASARAVLIGDRTVELVPPNRNIAGSNHRREGGWFYFTSGDAQWWPWNRLTAHPTSLYLWYWPRLAGALSESAH